MKINTKALLAMLAAFAVLPGCGKKNDQPAVAAVAAAPSVQNIGSGSCATVNYGQPVTLTFYGQLNGGTGIMGNLSIYGYGASNGGGSNYYRNLVTGDTVNVYVSGNTAWAVLSIAANTASAIVQGQSGYFNNGGSAQVCGMYINETISASPITGNGYTGTMGGGQIALWGNNSWITYGGQLITF